MAASRHFDAVVLTVPCGRVATLCPQLTAPERERLQKIVYQGVICPSLLLAPPARRLLRHEHHRLLGALHRRDRDDGARRSCDVRRPCARLPAAVSLPGRSDVAADRRLDSGEPKSIAALGRMYPNFRADDVIASRVARVRERASDLDARLLERSLCRRSQTSIDHVFVVNSAQIAYGTLNVNETLALAARQAIALAPLLRNGAGPSVGATARGIAGRTAGAPVPDVLHPKRRPPAHERLSPTRERIARRRQPVVVHEDPRRRRVGAAAVVL